MSRADVAVRIASSVPSPAARTHSVEVVCEGESWVAFFPLRPCDARTHAGHPADARCRPLESRPASWRRADGCRDPGRSCDRGSVEPRGHEPDHFGRRDCRADRLPPAPARCPEVASRRLRPHLAARGYNTKTRSWMDVATRIREACSDDGQPSSDDARPRAQEPTGYGGFRMPYVTVAQAVGAVTSFLLDS